MDERAWGHATWTESAAAGLGHRDEARSRVVALLPVGAVEAHGPHLPLVADVIIAQAAADAALDGIGALGFAPLVLPPLAYTAAPFAAEHPGTLSVRASTVSALLADIAIALARQNAAALTVVNAHLDPTHLASLRRGIADYEAADAERPALARAQAAMQDGAHRQAAMQDRSHRPAAMPVIFPDITRKPWALRLGDEFKSGACHAGQYETSVVMAAAPELVREESRQALPAHPVSLSRAHRGGASTFAQAGVPDAYCGDPAAATRREGEATAKVLGQIVTEAVAERLGRGAAGGRR